MILFCTLAIIKGANANVVMFNVLQMNSLWLPNTGTVYLPPSRPVARVLSTDEYVKDTSIFFYATSDRLLTVGHPYFPVKDGNHENVVVPKVSGNQFRAFRLKLPDPNKFALIENGIYDPNTERLVWRLRGIEVNRGGPLGIGTTGHPLFNKLYDTENPNRYQQPTADNRQNVSFDPKQNQLFVVGCLPCIGEHWDVAKACERPAPKEGDCPPLQLVNSFIEDGDMCDIGFGAMNFRALQADRSSAPLDINATTCKWPDFLKMGSDVYGDEMFFFGRREQLYTRHFFTRNGTVGDTIPDVGEKDTIAYVLPGVDPQEQKTVQPSIYFGTPSGSLVSSDANLFNRPYWINRAQGSNNGICWNNNVFVTLVDNTRSVNFTISVKTDASPAETYKATDYKEYLRHAEEFELGIIVQLSKVPLQPDILAHIQVMNPTILENWNLAFVPPAPTELADQYRYLNSLATRCPDAVPPVEKEDPFDKYNFWVVDLSDKFSTELTQSSLGRRFLYQTGLNARSVNRALTSNPRKRSSSSSNKSAKKRRRN